MIAHHRRNADWASRRSRTGVLEPQPLPPFAQASGGHSLRVRSVGAWTKRPQRTRIGGQQKPRRTGRGKRRGGAERGAWGWTGSSARLGVSRPPRLSEEYSSAGVLGAAKLSQ